MKDTDEITIARSNGFKKNLYHHVDKKPVQEKYSEALVYFRHI